jgi:hypothetical protein
MRCGSSKVVNLPITMYLEKNVSSNCIFLLRVLLRYSIYVHIYIYTYIHTRMCMISTFRRVLNVVCFLLGDSPASGVYLPTFRNTLFQLHRGGLKMEQTECSETLAFKHLNYRRRWITQKKAYDVYYVLTVSGRKKCTCGYHVWGEGLYLLVCLCLCHQFYACESRFRSL